MTNEWHDRRKLWRATVHFSSLALFKHSAGSHVPPRTCQAAPLFVFHSDVGTDLDKGWQRSLFSPPGSLEWRAGKLKTGFTRFLETIKQAGGPTVRERGRVRETVWQRVSRARETETPSQQIRNMCECMGRSVYVPASLCVCVCVCVWVSERERERAEKMTEWYRARAPARGFADAHKDLFTVSAPDDPPEDAGVAANTHPHGHTHHSGHISQQT